MPEDGLLAWADWLAETRNRAIAVRFGVLARPPSPEAVRTDLAAQALTGIVEDTRGFGWQKPRVEVTPGGR